MGATDHGRLRTIHFILRRQDGLAFLERWGIESERIGGIFLHKLEAPDPGVDLHDHPWAFLSIIFGGYTQERLHVDRAVAIAKLEEHAPAGVPRGVREHKRWLSFMRLNQCHRIIKLDRPVVWTLVIHGPHRRKPWGFYLPTGWMDEQTYKREVRARRGDIHVVGYRSRVLVP
jgi:hypothetical protein